VQRILYRLIAGLARLAVRSGRAKDLELIVLWEQLTILRSKVERPSLGAEDRTLLGATATRPPTRRPAPSEATSEA